METPEAEVLDIFSRENKPFSVQNITDLLAHRGHKKAAVTRALDALVAAGTVAVKVRVCCF
jgi:DNA-binding MarR family transcriptional regulator